MKQGWRIIGRIEFLIKEKDIASVFLDGSRGSSSVIIGNRRPKEFLLISFFLWKAGEAVIC